MLEIQGIKRKYDSTVDPVSNISLEKTRMAPTVGKKLSADRDGESTDEDSAKHVQYCQSDTDRESTSRPNKLLRNVNILYGPSLFVSAIGGRVKRLLNLQDMPTVHTVRTIRTDREPIHEPTNCYRP